jgi:hypothetical protein
MTDEALVRSCEAAEMPPGGFHHVEHVRIAWWYLSREPLPQALARFRAGLRHLARARGAPGKYHETITTAYVLLIHERLDAGSRALSWDAFAARHADLLAWRPSIIERYYRPETLASEEARRVFVAPDGSDAPFAGYSSTIRTISGTRRTPSAASS